MPHKKQEYLMSVIKAIEIYQYAEFFSDRELSLHAGLSATMVSKIKKGTTLPKLSTLRKLKIVGVDIPTPSREVIKNTQ